MNDIQIEQRLRELLYSQDPANIALAEQLAKGQGVDLKTLIKSWGLHPFGIKTPKDFEKITIDCSHREISDLSPLSGLQQLQSLDCSNNEIQDLSPLEKLPQLESLDFSTNQVQDLSPLVKLAKLWRLGINENRIPCATFEGFRKARPDVYVF